MNTVVDCTGKISLASHLGFCPSVSPLYLRRLEVRTNVPDVCQLTPS